MATLVLSTIGTALGGPVGGAIGSLVGQSIDRQLFGPGPRRGPRLDDLKVQTSTYGTQIPRLYGMMRVAGTVVWSTDLKEQSTLQSGGKGSPGMVTYGYSVSLAVALSSRPANGIKRIWADGKLLRGAAGDFKVKAGFRFYSGTEDQPIDPLIAAIEGAAVTPAYRGLALAVFEELNLAEFGNRIPFLTFEVQADPGFVSLGTLLADASNGNVTAERTDPIVGYAAYGTSVRSAIEPLVEHFAVDLFDDGVVLRSPGLAPAIIVEEDDLGCAAGDDPKISRVERTQTPPASIPASLSLSYYDQARDYLTGQMRAAIEGGSGRHEVVDLPAVLATDKAKALAEASLARRWARRDLITVRLPPSFVGTAPGSLLVLPNAQSPWQVEQATIDGMTAVLSLRAMSSGFSALPATPGRSTGEVDVIPSQTSLALFDLPYLGVDRRSVPVLHLAAANQTPRWRPIPLEITAGDIVSSGQTSSIESVLGRGLNALANSQADVLDSQGQLDVELVDEDHWLESCTDEALAGGSNLAVLGSELLQFGSAIPLTPRRFRLSRLLRGRRGSEWAMGTHVANEPFALLQPGSLRAIEVPLSSLGMRVEVKPLGVGDGIPLTIARFANGEALRPPSPVHLTATMTNGSLVLAWTRRSRDGFAWIDGVDAPIGESAERYAIEIVGTASSLQAQAEEPQFVVAPAQLSALGPGNTSVAVRQIGDLALSRPATISIVI